jgi:hypothetical protein
VGRYSRLPRFQSRQHYPGGTTAAGDNIHSGVAVTGITTAGIATADITAAVRAAAVRAPAHIPATGSIAATVVAPAHIPATGNVAITRNIAATGIADTITVVPPEARRAHSPASG